MYRSQLLVASALLAFAGPNLATVAGKDYVEVPWQTTSFTAILPAPFHSVSVTLLGEVDTPQKLEIEVNGESIAIDDELLAGLSAMKVESITYSDPTMTGSGSVEYFELFVPFGESYRVRSEPCDDPLNFTWEEDVAVFRVDKALTISMQVTSFRFLDQCERQQ